MILFKTKEEIELMKKSGEILAEVKQIVYDALRSGVSTKEINDLAHKEIIKRGAKPAFLGYGGFPGVACISINEELIHGIPSDSKIIKEGDLVKIDMGVIWKGYYSDSAFTKGIGKISKEDQRLIDIAKEAFYVGLNAIKPGARVGDIENAIGKFVYSKGLYVPLEFSGHGIGKNLHEDPYVHNQGVAGTGPLLKNGMVLAIEPMILQGSHEVVVLKDKWTVISKHKKNTSHYEHTVAIIDGYGVILTGDL